MAEMSFMNKVYMESETLLKDTLREQIVNKHKPCEGKGWRYDAKIGRTDMCYCYELYSFIDALIYTRLPKTFWGYPIESYALLSKKNALSLLKDIEKYMFRLDTGDHSSTMLLQGNSEVDTNLFLSFYTSAALISNKNIVFVDSMDLVRFIGLYAASKLIKDSDDEFLFDRIQGADILIVTNIHYFDLMGKFDLSKKEATIQYLKEAVNRGKGLVATTNTSDSVTLSFEDIIESLYHYSKFKPLRLVSDYSKMLGDAGWYFDNNDRKHHSGLPLKERRYLMK